jgi:hypothetical protein
LINKGFSVSLLYINKKETTIMNTSITLRKIIFTLSFSLFIFSCTNHVEEEETIIIENENPTDPVDPTDPDPDPDPVTSFSTDVKPIIDNNCVSCHGGSRFPDVRTYDKIKANASSIKSAIVNRRMPQGGSLTNAEIEIIRSWVDGGALNN